jgi:hypothetical protein
MLGLVSILVVSLFPASFAVESSTQKMVPPGTAPSAAPAESDAPPKKTHCKIVNLMPEFWVFWERAGEADVEYQIPVFRDAVLMPNDELYTSVVASNENLSSERLTQFLTRVSGYLRPMHSWSKKLPKDLEDHCKTFDDKFPDMDWKWNAYLMPSLFTFDAKTKAFQGQRALFLGVDTIASRDTDNLDVLYAHELFHIYHAQVGPEAFAEYVGAKGPLEPLYLTLWTEGLSTYVSKVLAPKATLADVLFSTELATKCPPLTSKLAADVMIKLDSRTASDHLYYFSAKAKPVGMPARSGYYIGMRIAEVLSKKHKLKDLARLSGKTLKQEIREALVQLADGK